jgi:hypothetical protein
MCHSAKASSAMGLDEEVGKVNLQRTEEGNRFHHQTGWKLRHWISEPGLSTRDPVIGWIWLRGLWTQTHSNPNRWCCISFVQMRSLSIDSFLSRSDTAEEPWSQNFNPCKETGQRD